MTCVIAESNKYRINSEKLNER